MVKIPFNKPSLIGNEIEYIKQAVSSGKISGDGDFTKKCHDFFEHKYQFLKAFLTPSCTAALEMAALLANISAEDEVIIPSFTFVSTANAFVLRGAKIVFADSSADHPNIDVDKIEALINEKTKAIVPVHYAGVACDMDKIMKLAQKYNLWVIEDAAQAINSKHKGCPLGKIGHMSAFSFHETKNIYAGEGGLLALNDPSLIKRAEIIREKGTNRSSFFRGEVNKYGWVDIGSSYLPSDITAAFLYGQLQKIEEIQKKRLEIWQGYYEGLNPLEEIGCLKLPCLPSYATNNAHMFYVICQNLKERQKLIQFLKEKGITSVFHYLPLHQSSFYRKKHDGRKLFFSQDYSDRLLRLPLFYDLSLEEVGYVVNAIFSFFGKKSDRLHGSLLSSSI